jgi:LPXTG-motif cell wall-anchored protein
VVGELPRTGARIGGLALIGTSMLGAGALVLAARRRRAAA